MSKDVSKIFQAFGNRRTAAVLFLGFSSGIPAALTATSLQAWMKSEGVNLGTIGLMSLVGLPYGLKFLWAPFLDRFSVPFLGRRRGWILVAQLFLALSIAAMAFSSPGVAPGLTAALAVAVAFFSASQDIVIDAHRTEILRPEERGVGVAAVTLGYRIAMLTSGAMALVLSDHISWRSVYLLMSATMIVGIVTVFFAPEPEVPVGAPRSMREAVLEPLAEFLKRKGAWEVLLFLIIYKLDTVFAVALTTPFMNEMGFSNTDIGAVTKGFGLVAALAGTAFGGAMLVRQGLYRSLWVFGILQGIAGMSFMTLARLGHHYPMMVVSIATENFFSGAGSAAYAAFMMKICDRRYTATQYALFSSLMAITRQLGGAPSGYIVKALGWEKYFLLSIALSLPGLALLTRYRRWAGTEERSEMQMASQTVS